MTNCETGVAGIQLIPSGSNCPEPTCKYGDQGVREVTGEGRVSVSNRREPYERETDKGGGKGVGNKDLEGESRSLVSCFVLSLPCWQEAKVIHIDSDPGKSRSSVLFGVEECVLVRSVKRNC